MREDQLKAIADNADVIVNGYAFTYESGDRIRVLNLNKPDSAAVFTKDGKMLETSMDDIELETARQYLSNNLEFMAA